MILQESTYCKYPQVLYEAKILNCLKDKAGFPYIYSYGVEGDQTIKFIFPHRFLFTLQYQFLNQVYNYIVIELLGPSLEDLYNICGRKFSLKTTLILINQALLRIWNFQKHNFIHRDIKPDNFLMGLKNKGSDVVHMIDFGLSKRYIDKRTKKHIEYRKDKYLTGTARYASEMSRRDDFESLAYMMIYFYKGGLPWQNLRDNVLDQCQKIKELKLMTPTKTLCQGCPKAMLKFVEYCKNLSFKREPDYERLQGYILSLADKEGINLEDSQFDWDENGFKTICEDPERARILNIQNSNVLEAYSAVRKDQMISRRQSQYNSNSVYQEDLFRSEKGFGNLSQFCDDIASSNIRFKSQKRKMKRHKSNKKRNKMKLVLIGDIDLNSVQKFDFQQMSSNLDKLSPKRVGSAENISTFNQKFNKSPRRQKKKSSLKKYNSKSKGYVIPPNCESYKIMISNCKLIENQDSLSYGRKNKPERASQFSSMRMKKIQGLKNGNLSTSLIISRVQQQNNINKDENNELKQFSPKIETDNLEKEEMQPEGFNFHDYEFDDLMIDEHEQNLVLNQLSLQSKQLSGQDNDIQSYNSCLLHSQVSTDKDINKIGVIHSTKYFEQASQLVNCLGKQIS